MLLAEIVFPIHPDKSFDYAVPDALADRIGPGHRVLAPLGGRRTEVGVALRLHDGKGSAFPPEKLKSLAALLDPEPALSTGDLALADWMARRTFCSRGEAVFGVLPVGRMRPPRRPTAPRILRESSVAYGAPRPTALTEDQTASLERIAPAVRTGGFAPFLLQGVNASGKTEVYLRLIETALEAGRTAILLVPEIGLTPQAEAHLSARFGTGVAVWHSALSAGERWRIWEGVRAGSVRVVAGPRSALFLPMPRLGLIVVDEEHDPSYKSDSVPHYNARDAALEKARIFGCPVVLGSATPSLESFQAARDGRLALVRMAGRVAGWPYPKVVVVDMRKEKGWYVSDALVNALRDRLAKGEQSLLLLNRRGFATQVLCKTCGWEARCPHCQVSLVYHKYEKRDPVQGELLNAATPSTKLAVPQLRCHLCEHRSEAPSRCPTCRGEVIVFRGQGTQRVESDLRQLFPAARILRWDRDATQGRTAHDRAFRSVRAREVDIIVGTKMIALGLDFPGVTLGGILDADAILRFPDFRSGERTFQLLSQMAGRVGRGDAPGEVLLQTRHPDHGAVRAAETFDYETFAEEELVFRREMGYPPAARLVSLLLRSKDAAKVEQAADGLVRSLEGAVPSDVNVLGPAPAFHHHREGFVQWQVILKATGDGLAAAVPLAKRYDLPSGVSLTTDADPEDLA